MTDRARILARPAISPGALIFLAALILRLAAVLLGPEPDLSPNAVGSSIGGAERLLDGKGFSDPTFPMFAPPLYGMVIAGSFAVFGRDLLPIRLAQAALDAATVLLVFSIVRSLFGRRAGIAAGALGAVYPFTIYAATYIGTETLFGFFFAVFAWISLRAISSTRWGVHVSTGVFMALASLTRASTQFYPFAWGATLWLVGRRDAAALARWTVSVLCFAAVIAPWTIRNWVVLDAFIPLSTSTAPLLCGSDEEFFTIEGRDERMDRYFSELEERGWQRPAHGETLEWESFYLRAALEKYRERLAEEGVLASAAFFVKKFTRLWFATESGHNHALIFVVNLPFYVLIVAGICLAWRRRVRGAWILAMPVLYLTALHTAVYAYFRYIVPVMPMLLGFAGVALAFLLERMGLLKEETGSRVTPSGSVSA